MEFFQPNLLNQVDIHLRSIYKQQMCRSTSSKQCAAVCCRNPRLSHLIAGRRVLFLEDTLRPPLLNFYRTYTGFPLSLTVKSPYHSCTVRRQTSGKAYQGALKLNLTLNRRSNIESKVG